MKQAPVEKYTIAFFRLAEYVSRGEKERALGVYRLLAHSFDDLAFARQLEGDILLSFNDDGAQDKYFQAAQLYQKDMRLRQASAVYEHLLMLHPKSAVYMSALIDVYSQLEMISRAKVYVIKLLDLAVAHANIPIVSQALLTHEALFSRLEATQYHERFVYIVLKAKYTHRELMQEHIRRVIDYLLELQHHQELTHFFTMLNGLDASEYLSAHNYYKAKQNIVTAKISL